jgi:hypothetical protein
MKPWVPLHRIRSRIRDGKKWVRGVRVFLVISDKAKAWEADYLKAERTNTMTPEIKARYETLEEVRKWTYDDHA